MHLLTYEQKKSMMDNGYIHIPGVVPKIMVDHAVRHINHSLGQGMNESDIIKFRSQSYCPELQGKPVISDLYNKTPVKDLVASLIGEGKALPINDGQIALRFPTMQDPPHAPVAHLDGMYTPTNGMTKGTIGNFTMLVGVLLSPVQQAYAGNFTVWPGTHHLYEQYFREHGPEALLNGMPPVAMPQPLQTTGEPGDVFLVHYQLGHTAAPNIASLTRYAIFFRVKHVDVQKDWKAPMTDIWLHWPGIREIMA
ncbi:hypothetical protein [Paenibacillus spongiae]|uniref:Phytanoyl-CoA dioxygenase family protein n=1 Tax=Paenibacillus spongiae TaxID=2909671 RepID=A0ABY5S4E1_9BACL|nr:hypothetical protein [Paenibacillus spongiae]UVI28764.1 hypothetical protein L1F29_25480 [Paenibacillus spongiae]